MDELEERGPRDLNKLLRKLSLDIVPSLSDASVAIVLFLIGDFCLEVGE